MHKVKVITRQRLAELSVQAKANPRLRQNLNLHDNYADPSQRLLNAMEPGTYLQPHRHLLDPKPESFVGLLGKLALITFNNDGKVNKIYPFGPKENILCIDLPEGIWHTVVCLEAGSVFYETKPGPYIPLSEEDMAPWAPSPDAARSAAYLNNLISQAGVV